MPTLAKLLQDSPDSPMDHAPVATTPDERLESPVDVDDDKHVQLTVANQGSLRLVSKLFGAHSNHGFITSEAFAEGESLFDNL
ncbi:hypothetical protein B0H13DRAFT_2364770 [Mycena leptocephala]|nr:hypothetical protein B0H13DRAFT_2364770 [Mycena leptocephala]